MKNKYFLKLICLVVIALHIATVLVSADSQQSTFNDAKSVIERIVAYKKDAYGVKTTQELIDEGLAKDAGIGAEWYIFALAQEGEYSFESYENELCRYLGSNPVYSYSTRQKFALCLSAIGSTDQYISYVMDDSIGKQGIMSFVYGLHLLNNGYESDDYTAEQVVDKLLSLQSEDGGWSLTGKAGDVDVTAMTCQALSVYYKTDDDVRRAVDKAVDFLSSCMSESCDFSSYGVYNAESTAQVLLALCSLDIDCTTDSRFIKNGKTLFDGISRYALADGGYSHEIGGAENENATSQVLYTMVAYRRMRDGKTPIYILDRADPQNLREYQATSVKDTESTSEAVSSEDISADGGGYKLWLSIGILGVGAVACIALLLAKKKGIKHYIVVGVLVALGIIVVWSTNITSTDEYYSGETVTKANPIGTVTITIRCDKIADRLSPEDAGKDGVILEESEFVIEDGDTVYDILVEAAKKYRIQMENNGTADAAYIVGLNNLYEMQFGDLSGWVYSVNGKTHSVSCSQYKLSDNDRIEWHYTLELGNDIK